MCHSWNCKNICVFVDNISLDVRAIFAPLDLYATPIGTIRHTYWNYTPSPWELYAPPPLELFATPIGRIGHPNRAYTPSPLEVCASGCYLWLFKINTLIRKIFLNIVFEKLFGYLYDLFSNRYGLFLKLKKTYVECIFFVHGIGNI